MGWRESRCICDLLNGDVQSSTHFSRALLLVMREQMCLSDFSALLGMKMQENGLMKSLKIFL